MYVNFIMVSLRMAKEVLHSFQLLTRSHHYDTTIWFNEKILRKIQEIHVNTLKSFNVNDYLIQPPSFTDSNFLWLPWGGVTEGLCNIRGHQYNGALHCSPGTQDKAAEDSGVPVVRGIQCLIRGSWGTSCSQISREIKGAQLCRTSCLSHAQVHVNRSGFLTQTGHGNEHLEHLICLPLWGNQQWYVHIDGGNDGGDFTEEFLVQSLSVWGLVINEILCIV